MAQSFTPVIIGVGEAKNTTADCIEPLHLILDAVRHAAADATSEPSVLAGVDSVDAVRTWTWPYDDLAGSVADGLGASPAHKFTMDRHSGHSPAFLLDQAAKRIARGESKLAVVVGGESQASLNKYVSEHKQVPPHWTKTKKDLHSIFAQEVEARGQSEAGRHGLAAPIQVYPLYENAFRAARGQSVADNHAESVALYADFAQTAAHNEHAWSYGKPAETAASIGAVTRRNRMICLPYPLLMNAFNVVNLSAAILLTSTEHAAALGVPQDRWIYPLGAAGTAEPADILRRCSFSASACIARTLTAALAAAAVDSAAVGAFDFYSCFPVVPKLACAHLGLPTAPPFDRPVSLLGGLTSFGGAGNNYSTHAIAAMTRHLRRARGTGLVLANGGVATYQHAVVLGAEPRAAGGYPLADDLPKLLPGLADDEVAPRPEGAATVETYTVDFVRDGSAATGYVVGRLVRCGRRFVAVHGDERTLAEMAAWRGEIVGRSGMVKAGAGEDGENLFFLDAGARM